MMSRKLPVSLLLLTCGLAALPACGGDDGGGSGDATATGTDPDTSTGTQGMTSSVTMDDSASLTDPDTTMDPSETTDPTEDTTDTVDPDTSTGDVPGTAVAFRFNSVAIRDPHFIAFGLQDITTMVNALLSDALTADDPEMPDGLYDLGFVLVFDPLAQADGAGGDFSFANADCTAEADPAGCVLKPGTELYASSYTSSAAGPCQEPNPANLTPEYTPAPGSTTGPCFASAMTNVVIATSSFSLPLENATVAARYVGDPAGNLVEGTIIGFVTIAAAEAAIVDGTGELIDGQSVAQLLPDSAMDEGDTGWWLHMEFTAVPAGWNG